MATAPEPLTWLNLTFRDRHGTLHAKELTNAELHTDAEFGCCLFEPREDLIQLQKLKEELDGCDDFDGDEFAL